MDDKTYGNPVFLSVEECDEGDRLDSYLMHHLSDISRTRLQALIQGGAVLCNGKIPKNSCRLRSGDKIEIRIPAPEQPDIPPVEMALDILYEDGDLLIVNKPQGLTVHPSPGHTRDTLVNGIMEHCGSSLSGINGVLRPGIVHRIDKDTSGALIICKNDRAHRFIADLLKDHKITRLYRGIVCGVLPHESGTVRGNIGRNPRDRKKMAVVPEGGKPAVTHYRVIEKLSGYTYCEFRLETGRTHQIRVHMASIGHPLLGDPLYGPGRRPFPLDGQLLHAMVIGFPHPSTGEYMEFTAPLPGHFQTALKKLSSHSL